MINLPKRFLGFGGFGARPILRNILNFFLLCDKIRDSYFFIM